jgi:hypothetical protein
MANFDNINVGCVLKIKDASFMKDPVLIEKYINTYATVLMKDFSVGTVYLNLFDGIRRWVKVERVTNTFEIME